MNGESNEKGRYGKGREGMGWEGKGRYGKGREGMGREKMGNSSSVCITKIVCLVEVREWDVK